MECDFSLPVDYQGNPPTNTLDSFAFTHMSCVSTPASVPTATYSSTVEFSTPTAQAIHDSVYVSWMGFTMVIFALGVISALEYLRRR